MKDTIEVPAELVRKLHEWADHHASDHTPYYTIRGLVRQIPRPEPALELCPFCGAKCEIKKSIVDSVVCTGIERCGYIGPDDDFIGEKHNQVARAAREGKTLRRLWLRLEQGLFNSDDEILAFIKEETK